jgi:hypothetical protein
VARPKGETGWSRRIHAEADELKNTFRHCEELRLFCGSKTNDDEAIHVFLKSKFDIWRKWIASSRE